ncbi:class II glutamine amidotransferase [Paeniglutamicibacter psychrophenolicus]|uniref:Glutamine amidotransferase n=1 Tax=Paeniglutamicibacter psychrophenolicus TaxID=257454 RepID=A0ABS4WEY9_9MICC|nr:class II glutamine amidotransferase [Paeniglutamicibacter psychrophenolicus]MBP2374774.1 glutamine amidotransferase [Paeniglutamicibacter psychrophenolicus]
MCRLFGLHAGLDRAKATFWLLQAPNSLSLQSHYEPDGTGIGTFDARARAMVSKQPLTAWQDREFAAEARHLESTTFLAHVRYASTGGHTRVNTHPFEQDNRLFAHNGVLGGLAMLEARLETVGTRELVRGQTDSERMFALVTAEIRLADGDVAAGITAAVNWIAQNLPVYSLNFILTTATDLWALRYPETHELYILDRPPGPVTGAEPLVAHSHRIRAHSHELATRRVVIVATEKMTAHPDWRLLEPGELLHVNQDLAIGSHLSFGQPPRRMIKLEQLGAAAAASQHPQVPA